MEYNSRESQHIMRDYNEFMMMKKMCKIEMSVEVLSLARCMKRNLKIGRMEPNKLKLEKNTVVY